MVPVAVVVAVVVVVIVAVEMVAIVAELGAVRGSGLDGP